MDLQEYDNKEDALKFYPRMWGTNLIELTNEQLHKLLLGKAFATDNGEYRTVITIRK